MFCGDSRHTVDAKNRVFLPKRFQQDLELDQDGNRVAVLTRGLDGCLFLFTEEGLETALERMDTQAFAKADRRKLQRLFFSYTSRVTLDASGRLLLPEKLRTLAAIEREVVMIGVRERVEIWSAARWDLYESAYGEDFEDLENVLTGSLGNSDSEGSADSGQGGQA